MATATRGTKSVGGGTDFASGTILTTEVNTDFNTIYTDYNGNITNVNIAAAAAIATTKIDDVGDMTTEVTPGITGGLSAPTTLEGEITRLRYKLAELSVGTSTKRLDGTAGVDLVSWMDTPQTGPNLIRNGNFAISLPAGVNVAPSGWDLVVTPTIALTTALVSEGHSTMRAIRLTAAGAANEGISQTLVGLKASTLYIVGCRARCVGASDTFTMTTTGATGTPFNNLALTTTSQTYVTIAGMILTDATPTNVVVSLLATADGDIVDVTHCWVRECAIDKIAQSNTAWAYQEITGNTPGHYGPTLTDSGLSVSVVPPGPGYTIEVECKLMARETGADDNVVAVLKESGTEVDCIGLQSATALGGGVTCSFSYRKLNPTPGTTYTYTAEMAFSSADRNGAAFATGETPKSWIRCRAVLESGGH